MRSRVVFAAIAVAVLHAAGCSEGGDADEAGAEVPRPESIEAGDDEAGASAAGGSGGESGVEPSPLDIDASTPEVSQEAAAPPPSGDDGPVGQAPTGDDSDTRSLVGLWDYTRETAEGPDVALFSIDPDGRVTEFDYRGDAAGDGRECYLVADYAIASRGDDRYDIQNGSSLPGSSGADDVLITVESDEIVFRYLGDVFDPEFGSGQVGITETYPAVRDRQAEELPRCES